MDSGAGAHLCADLYWEWLGLSPTTISICAKAQMLEWLGIVWIGPKVIPLRVSYTELVEMISKLLILACLANVVASKGLRGSSYNPPIYNHSWTHAHIKPITQIQPIQPIQSIQSIKYTYTDVPVYTAHGYTTEGQQKSTSLRYH